MRRERRIVVSARLLLLCLIVPRAVAAADAPSTTEAPAAEPKVDPAPFTIAASTGDDDGIVQFCGALIGNDAKRLDHLLAIGWN